MFKKSRGSTFLELIITSAIIVIAVLGLLAGFINSLKLVYQAREMDIATDDMKDVMEKIRCVAFSDLVTVFPNNANVPAALIGGFQLQGETIVVRYPAGMVPDPLLIEVQATWTGRDRRIYTQTFRTMRTRGL